MRTSRLVAVTAGLLAATLTLTACGDDDSGDETGPIKIGVIAEQTGPVAVLGLTVDGMQKAVDYINADGGIDGRDIELDVQDTAADPAKAVSALNAFADDGVQLVLGGAFGADCAAEGPAAERLELVVLCLSPDPLPEQDAHMFGIGAPYEVANAAYVEELSTYGDKVGVFAEKAQGGDDMNELLPPAFDEFGVDIVIERTDPEASSYKAGIQRVLAEDVDALWFTQCSGTVLSGVADAQSLGFDGKIMIENCLASDDIAGALQPNAAANPGQILNMLPAIFAPDEAANEDQRAAIDLYLDVVETRDAVIADGWDAVWAAKKGIEAAGSTDYEDLLKAFEDDFEFEGVFHRGTWTADDHRGVDDGAGLLVPVVVGEDGLWHAK